MSLTWLTKTKQYFTTKVFSEDRFRTNDKPTESEYSNLFQSIVFKVHDLATMMLAGIVRKASLIDILLGRDEKQTLLSGYSHNEPLYVSPSALREFSVEAGTILDWIPFRKTKTTNGQLFADNAGNILDTEFVTLFSVTTIAGVNFYDPNVINYFEKEYLPQRFKICDGRVLSFSNPYTNLTETVQLPNLKERVLRGAGDNSTIPNNLMEQYGGVDFQNLSHTHEIEAVMLSAGITPNPIVFSLNVSELPTHAHNYDRTTVNLATQTVVTAGGTSSVSLTYASSASITPTATTNTGGGNPITLNPTNTYSDISTTIENPADTINFPTGFLNVDNRQKFFNTYKIIALW